MNEKYSTIPHLKAIHYFVVVARLKSIKDAAYQLCVSSSAVSKQIKQLEDRLGLALFIRKTRQLSLSHEGDYLYQKLKYHFDGIQHTLQSLQPTEQKALVISCEPTLSMQWLIPKMVDFYAKYPDINVSIHAGGGPVNFDKDGIDLAIRRHDFPIEPSYYTRSFMKEALCLVMSEDYYLNYVAKNKKITLLCTKSREKLWDTMPNQLKEFKFRKKYFGHFYLAIEAAKQGLGVLLVPHCLVERELLSKSLYCPYSVEQTLIDYVLFSPNVIQSKLHKLFQKWLLSRVNTNGI